MTTPQSANDKVIVWLLTVLVVDVPVGWIASWAQDRWWLYLLLVLFVVLILATLPGGFFSRDRYGPTLLGRIAAAVVLTFYLLLSPYLASDQELIPALASVGLIWLAATFLTWRSLRAEIPLHVVAMGFAGLLFGVEVLLSGVGFLRVSESVFGVAVLLLGVAGLLLGVGLLRVGESVFGVAVLLLGVAVLLLGVGLLRDVKTLRGVAGLLCGVVILFAGVGFLRDGNTVFGIASLLCGVAFFLLGVAVLGIGKSLFGVVGLLFGALVPLLGVMLLRAGSNLGMIAVLLVEAAIVFLGVSVLLSEVTPLNSESSQTTGIGSRLHAWQERLVRRDDTDDNL